MSLWRKSQSGFSIIPKRRKKMRRLIYVTLVIALLLSLAIVVPAGAAPSRADRGAWAPNVWYNVNDTVTYGGSTYKCLQAHTSLTGWEPPNVPALWQLGPTVTNTPVGPTSTRTNTPIGPTATRTNTPIGPTATRTNTPSGTGCWTPWVSSTAYNGGAQVSYNGQNYQAAYWTQGDTPDTHSGPAGSGQPWIPMGACGGGGVTNTPTRTNTPTGPTLTPTRSPTPCTTCGGGLPKHVITGYWQNFNNGATVLRLSSVPSAYNLIAVAFADASGSAGAVAFNVDSGLSTALGGYTNANFTSDVATIHGRGQKVIISVGGQNGTISVTSSSAATNFANSVISLMNTFGFDGVDIDLENGINATYMGQALRSIVASKPGAIITFAPQTIDFQSTSAGYYQLAINIKDILTINNMQYYNSGSMNGCNGQVYSQGSVDFITSQACIQLQAGLRPDQVGLGLPASTSGAGSGYVSPSVINAALDCLAAGTNCGSFHPTTTWPGIRGAMTWSINWDASNGYAWVNAISAHLGSVP
jgi:chitinase/chitodextrinase